MLERKKVENRGVKLAIARQPQLHQEFTSLLLHNWID